MQDYKGGPHVFSDGSDVSNWQFDCMKQNILQDFHSDYFSGWDEKELQKVLDDCENDSDIASPVAFCSEFLTFRGKGKTEGVQVEDDDIAADLAKIQPSPIDTTSTISAEAVTGVGELVRGVCTGKLITASSATPTTPFTQAGPTTDPRVCCSEKKVGGVVYRLLGEEEAAISQFSCLSACTYTRVRLQLVFNQNHNFSPFCRPMCRCPNSASHPVNLQCMDSH